MDKLDLELDNDEDDEDDEVEEENDDDDDSEAVYEPEEANDDDDSSDGDVQDGKVIIDDIDGGGPVSDADEPQLSSNTVDTTTTTSSSSTSTVDVKNSIGKDMLSNVYKALLPKRKVALTLENVMKWDLVVALMSSSQVTEAEVAELYHRCTGSRSSSGTSSGASSSRGSSSGSRKEMSLAQFEDFTMQLNRLQEPAAASPPVPLVGTVMESPCSTCNACHC